MFLLVINSEISAYIWISGNHFWNNCEINISVNENMNVYLHGHFVKIDSYSRLWWWLAAVQIYNDNETQETSSVIHFHGNFHSIIIYIAFEWLFEWRICTPHLSHQLKNSWKSELSFCETKQKCWINGEYWTANMLYLHIWFVSMNDNDIELQSKWKYINGCNSTKHTKNRTVEVQRNHRRKNLKSEITKLSHSF